MKTKNTPVTSNVAAYAMCFFAASSLLANAKKEKNDKYDKSDNDATNTAPDIADNHKIPPDPVGWITAFPTVVQTGTKPMLTWSITYPSLVEDYVDIIQPATINPTETLDVEVRVLGNGVTATAANSNSFTFVDAQALISFDGGSYNQIFYGDNHDVNPSRVVWSRKNIQAGDTLRFGGRYYHNGWGPIYTSSSGTQNVRVLVNGDSPPTNVPDYDAPSLEDFIKPYLGQDGKVKIGPMDVIVFMELTHTDSQQQNTGYDLQDMVLLVTFTSNKPKNNNGHGNNLDGVDASNPGNAPFMKYDSDPNVDDEGGGGGAYPSNP